MKECLALRKTITKDRMVAVQMQALSAYLSLPFSMSSASSSSDVSTSGSSAAPSGSSLGGVGSSVTPGLIGALAKLVHDIVLLAPGHIITALNKAQILSSIIE